MCSIELGVLPNKDSNKLAREIQSKYEESPFNINCIPPHPKSTWFPENLLHIVSRIMSEEPTTMQKPLFTFDFSMDAAEKNWKVLKSHNLCLESVLSKNKNTQLGYGSEFKPPSTLEAIFKNHPLWKRLKVQLSQGASYPLEELDKEEQVADLNSAL